MRGYSCQALYKTSVMRKLFALAVASLLCGSVFLFQGCLKDSYTRTHTYTYYKPLYKTADEVRANIRTNTPSSIEKPGKIFVYIHNRIGFYILPHQHLSTIKIVL